MEWEGSSAIATETLTRHAGMNYPSGTEGQNLIVSAAQAELLKYFERKMYPFPFHPLPNLVFLKS